MKETTLAKIVFILCFLACLLWPREGGAQTVFPAITKEAATPTGVNTLFAWAMDTVSVRVLCESPARAKCLDCNPGIEFRSIKQERTFEKHSLPTPYKHDPFLGHAIVWDWVVTKTRWLDPIEGCYQLTPLADE